MVLLTAQRRYAHSLDEGNNEKKMYSMRREAVAFSLAGVVSLIAFVSCGDTVTWNTKQMFSGTTTLSDDIVLAGEVEVEVSKGTLTLSGSVSGSGAIRKTGSGTLVMAHADNGFKASSGSSIVVEAGIIQADATGALAGRIVSGRVRVGILGTVVTIR